MLKTSWDRILAARAVLLAIALIVVCGSEPVQAQEKTAAIDPKAEKHLKQMCTYLAGLKQFTFEGEELIDEVMDNGQKLQFSNQRKVSVSRPNKLFSEFKGDLADHQFVFNGETAILFDKDKKVYGSQAFKGSSDDLIEMLHNKLGFTVPLSDLIVTNCYKILTQEVSSGAYIGKHSVGGTSCHHLAFMQKLVDWQIWIDTGDEPLPRKIVITQKQLRGEPQFTALLSRWNTSPKLADSMFNFTPASGIRQIDFLRVPETENSKTRKLSPDGK
jgi:hypothetical protein